MLKDKRILELGKSRKALFGLFFFVYFISHRSWGATVYRASSETVGHKAWEFELQGSYFETTGHFDHNGRKTAMVGEESYRKFDTDLSAKYGMSEKLEFSTGLKMRQSTAVVDDSTQGVVPLEAQGIESYFAGAKYSVKYDPRWNLGLEVLYKQSAFNNKEYSSANPLASLELGDEVQELGLGLQIAQRVSANPIFSCSAMYFRRSNYFSHEVHYKAEGAYRFTTFAFLAGVEGIYSLKSDPYTKEPENKPPLYTRPTYLFNSVNRSLLAPYVGGNLKISQNWLMKFVFRRVMDGVSTDLGNEGILSITWNLPGKSREEKFIGSFKEYEVEASVVKISPRGIFLKIDKGVGDDLQKGMTMDIYQFDYLGGNVLVASGVVYEVGAESAIVKIFKKYRNDEIKVGFVARGKIGQSSEAVIDE